MPDNDFVPFAIAGGANVISQADYEALPALSTGFTAGLATSAQINKAWRQSAFGTAALGELINNTGADALDNGDLAAFVALLQVAIATAAIALAGQSSNLMGSSAGAVKTAAWTADRFVVATALDGVPYPGTNLNLNFDGGTVGANGMDTGATPISSTLRVYVIYNPTTKNFATLGTVAGAGQTIYPGAHMPAGYTASALLFPGVTDGAGKFVAFAQQGREVAVSVTIFLAVLGVAVLTARDISAAVPLEAKTATGVLSGVAAGVGSPLVASALSGVFTQQVSGTTAAIANVQAILPFRSVPLLTAQTIYWNAGAALSNWNLAIFGYTF